MLIKVCPKSGERQSKNDFLLIFFYIQSKGAAQSSILMILRHPQLSCGRAEAHCPQRLYNSNGKGL